MHTKVLPTNRKKASTVLAGEGTQTPSLPEGSKNSSVPKGLWLAVIDKVTPWLGLQLKVYIPPKLA
jgi:hypothetical protein